MIIKNKHRFLMAVLLSQICECCSVISQTKKSFLQNTYISVFFFNSIAFLCKETIIKVLIDYSKYFMDCIEYFFEKLNNRSAYKERNQNHIDMEFNQFKLTFL